MSDRALLVSLLRWGRANGWRRVGNWDGPWWTLKGSYRIFLDWFTPDGQLHIRIDDKTAQLGLMDYWPRTPVEAVKVLKALSILPDDFPMNVAEPAREPVCELGFDERAERWTGDCSHCGLFYTSIDGTADGHDDVIIAWLVHAKDVHGFVDNIESRAWLAPVTLPEFRRKTKEDV